MTRETKPSVPSEPIINLLSISIGSEGGKSARALIEYPVVFLIEYFLWMSSMSGASACTRLASEATPSSSAACDSWKAAREAASAVSRIVPSTSTTRMSCSVW